MSRNSKETAQIKSSGQGFIKVGSSSINSILRSIKDSSTARIKLATEDGSVLDLDCIFKEDNPPNFYLMFPPNTLPEDINLKVNHPISIKQDSSNISLSTTVIEKVNDRTLLFTARSTLDPASLREYFRVNTSTSITVSFESGKQSSSSSRWSHEGHTQDLSGSGVLALFSDEPKNNNHIIIEIFIPSKQLTVNAVGHVVRKKKLRNRKWQVSFHFDNISTKHRDSVIQFLLSEQRKQLRENVRVID